MAIVFPVNPSVNDTFTVGSITYKWDSTKWIGLGVTPTDRLLEGSNSLEINASNELIWTGGAASFAGGAAVIASSGNLSINRTTGTNDILNGKLNGSVTSTLNANGLIELGSASNSTNNNGLYLGGHNGSFNLYTTRYTSDCFQILNTSGSGTNVALRAYGNGDVEIAGTIQTNTKSAGNIELDSTGAFTSPKIKLFASTGAATFSGVCKVDRTVSGDGCFHAALNGTVNASITSAGYAVFSGGEYNNEVYINGTDASTQRYLNFNRPTAGQYRATLRRDAWYLGENVGSIGNVTPTGANITLKMNGDIVVGKSSSSLSTSGLEIASAGQLRITRGTNGDFVKFYHTNGSQVGAIRNIGGTTTDYIETSDYRLKENVVDITDGITRLKQLQPRRFNFIVDPDTTVDGFIAHEAQSVVPQAVCGTKDEVDENNDPVLQGIDKSKLVPLLTAALQEAVAEIETLKGRLDAAGL